MDEQIRRERGETLIELLVAMLVAGTAIVVLMGGLGTSVRISDIHRKQAKAGAYLRSFAEAVESAVAKSPSDYQECASGLTYESAFTIVDDPRYERTVDRVRYWDGTSFGTTCTAPTDTGVQQVSLRVRSIDDDAVETLDLVIRKPCRSADGACR
jgi:type II secretory pathway pseudopilin PulG